MANNHQDSSPIVPANQHLPEITLRGTLLGIILTIILAAANAFLSLKLGATVSASIPAAVISMGILRFFRKSNILENNMVQTMASVGEALTAGVTFILPALIIIGAWHDFNYWQTMSISLLGGGLGVLFTIPLRRALLHDKSLRYPEGVAIGNVLKASTMHEKGDLNALVKGGVVGSIIALFQSGFQILTDSFAFWVKTPSLVFGFGLGLSPALIAAGYIVGINVSLSILLGIVLGWILGVPLLTLTYGMPAAETAEQIATLMWHSHVRYIGVGTMLIGGLWTLFTLAKPLAVSIATSIATLRKAKLDSKHVMLRTEHDIPIHYVLMGVLILLVPLFFLIANKVILPTANITVDFRYAIAAFSALYVLIAGFMFCSISAYFAGLIGSTNNPVSGLSVSVLLILCLAFLAIASLQVLDKDVAEVLAIVAIGCTVVVSAGLAISNDTMQDLKVGQIVGATPWKQQMMLVVGVIVSSLVIPPILQLLYQAYGIAGVFPRPGMSTSQMLAAPQAGLMATITQGAFSHHLQWNMIIIGASIAVVCIIIDEILKKHYDLRCPVLAVGLGIYLPLDASVPCVIGGVLSYLLHKRLQTMYQSQQTNVAEQKIHNHNQNGLLLACGLVAGASIMGVLLAIPFAIKESSDALRIMPENWLPFSGALSVVVTFFLCLWMYRFVLVKK